MDLKPGGGAEETNSTDALMLVGRESIYRYVVAILLYPTNTISTRTSTPRSDNFVSPIPLPLCEISKIKDKKIYREP